MITTGGTKTAPATFAFLYGYAEARMQVPSGDGMWPAFWLLPTDRTWPPEIDIMEGQGVRPAIDFVTIHWGAPSDRHYAGKRIDTGADLGGGYHVYAVAWQRDRVTWYFDGRPIWTYSDEANIPHKPMYLVLDLSVGGWLPGQLDPSPGLFPATMSVDYVRVWKRAPNR